MIGKNVHDLFRKAEADFFEAKDQEALRGKGPIDIPEETVQTRSKGLRVLHTIKLPILDKKGIPQFLLSISEDITEHKRDESVNMARLRLLQFAANHTLDELLEATLNEAETLSGSLISFYHFIESDQQTLSLQNWSTRTKAEFCKAEGKGLHYDISAAGIWADCVHERKPIIHNDYASLPHRKGMPPGHAPVVRELVVPVFRGEKIVAILGVGNKPWDYTHQDVESVSLLANLAWEITERKRAEQALQESEDRYSTIFNTVHVGLFLHDLEGRVLDVNQTLADLYGIRREEAPKMEIIRDFSGPDNPTEQMPAIWKRVVA